MEDITPVELTPEQKVAQEMGRRGGKATAKKYGPEHYRRIQALGVKTKLQKKNRG